MVIEVLSAYPVLKLVAVNRREDSWKSCPTFYKERDSESFQLVWRANVLLHKANSYNLVKSIITLSSCH